MPAWLPGVEWALSWAAADTCKHPGHALTNKPSYCCALLPIMCCCYSFSSFCFSLGFHSAFHSAALLCSCRYDAGDNVKFNFPMAWSAHVLAWSIVDFADVGADRATPAE
jgi:hypothetical protein